MVQTNRLILFQNNAELLSNLTNAVNISFRIFKNKRFMPPSGCLLCCGNKTYYYPPDNHRMDKELEL